MGAYAGVAADFIVKSHALTALGFSTTTGSTTGYPMKATLRGKCNVEINRASDGASLASEGNDTFIHHRYGPAVEQ